MHGLPYLEELAGEDDLLSGDLPVVTAQFAYTGDSQSESSLALWDEERGAWVCPIPDSYLTRHEDVHVYISVYYGKTEELGSRTKTMYEAVFRPISRPAPSDEVTQDQIEVWAAKKADIEMMLDNAEAASGNAQSEGEAAEAAAAEALAAAQEAAAAGSEARAAKAALDRVGTMFTGLAVAAVDLPAGSAPTVVMTEASLVYGLPQGAQGPQGETGVDGPADISITMASGVLTIVRK